MTDNITLPRAVVEFLLGEGPLDGVWYGDEHPTNPRPYWWRKHIRAELAEPPAIAELFAQFAVKQRPLDADMASIINANLDSLYITDEPAAALAEPEQKPEPVAVDLAKEGSDKTVISFVTLPSPAKPEPATDEQVTEADESHEPSWIDYRDGWRAAERWHGITKEDKA